jgi:hypothetical protein
LINTRIVNLVDDAVAEREPKPATGVIGRSNALFALEVQRGSIPGAPKATELSVGFIYRTFEVTDSGLPFPLSQIEEIQRSRRVRTSPRLISLSISCRPPG